MAIGLPHDMSEGILVFGPGYVVLRESGIFISLLEDLVDRFLGLLMEDFTPVRVEV